MPRTGPPESAARNFLTHLRLPFQLLLAPFMFWGAVLAHGRLSWRFAAAFAILTVCFYGGTTAFNSHYDRDEGPVGGLENPPPAGPWLLTGSLCLQGAGLALAWLVSPAFCLACAVFAVLGVLYSHPATRWKGNPWLSWLTVMLGQGALGAAAGAAAATGGVPRTPEMPLGLLAAALAVGGLYPLSHLYQMDEDRARGDCTVAVVLGRGRAVAAAMALLCAGVGTMAAAMGVAGRAWDARLLPLAAVGLVAMGVWTARETRPRALFRRVMRLQVLAGAGFSLYTLARLIWP